ncbi:hypothetical protein HPB50_010745 [Hyalomma asiaticum]|uniref:Uncharacterized protein n=1 Tax=Hyalomma asiaticum TaxID=266040 RepID=A0ACB7T788_HYAAI|nr:hypothetical protein HPB50_010745 [Hyalomma asiaticum]
MRMTNAEQYELLREIIHRQTTTFGATPTLRIFLTGPARCGKTFVLRLVMDVYNRYNDSGPHNAFVICASTGKAAAAVGGTSVHSAFKLSRSKAGDAGLSDSQLNTFRVAFRYVKCVIVNSRDMEIDCHPSCCDALFYYGAPPCATLLVDLLPPCSDPVKCRTAQPSAQSASQARAQDPTNELQGVTAGRSQERSGLTAEADHCSVGLPQVPVLDTRTSLDRVPPSSASDAQVEIPCSASTHDLQGGMPAPLSAAAGPSSGIVLHSTSQGRWSNDEIFQLALAESRLPRGQPVLRSLAAQFPSRTEAAIEHIRRNVRYKDGAELVREVQDDDDDEVAGVVYEAPTYSHCRWTD